MVLNYQFQSGATFAFYPIRLSTRIQVWKIERSFCQEGFDDEHFV